MSELEGVTHVGGVAQYQYFADGKWRPAESGKLFDLYQPYDRALHARVAACGKADAQIAIEAAAKAFPT